MPRHDLDPLALIAGVGFAGLGAVSLLSTAAGLEARWAWPLLLIMGGLVGLVASRRHP